MFIFCEREHISLLTILLQKAHCKQCIEYNEKSYRHSTRGVYLCVNLWFRKETGSIMAERVLRVFMLNNNVHNKNYRTDDDLQ